MNRRTSKLLDHVVNAFIRAGDKPVIPASVNGIGRFNHARNAKRKLARTWNAKPRIIRGAERLGIIRTLIAMEEARV